jgi:hypothetical protein
VAAARAFILKAAQVYWKGCILPKKQVVCYLELLRASAFNCCRCRCCILWLLTMDVKELDEKVIYYRTVVLDSMLIIKDIWCFPNRLGQIVYTKFRHRRKNCFPRVQFLRCHLRFRTPL